MLTVELIGDPAELERAVRAAAAILERAGAAVAELLEATSWTTRLAAAARDASEAAR
jgi:hypothetical protein